MNICITSHDMEPQYICGIKRVSATLANEWAKEHNVYFLAFLPLDNTIDNISGIPQFHFPNPDDIQAKENLDFLVRFIKENNIDIILHQHANIYSFTKLCVDAKKKTEVKLITTRHFSITHNHDITRYSFFIANRLQKSLICWFKDIFFYLKYHLYKKRLNIKREKQECRFLIEESDRFVLLSKSYIKDLEKQVRLSKDDHKKLYAINNPIEIYEHKNADKKKKVLWCGRVEYGVKRVDRILEIWRTISPKYPDWDLFIMGSGNINYFESITRKQNIPNVTFTGSCNPYEYYKDGAILCTTSSTEGLPMVILEAQMCGCVPIAYNSFSSLSDLITDGINGFAIPAFNKRIFTKRLEWLMNNETDRKKMASACQESVKRFEIKIIAKQWIELFNKVISE